MTPNFDRIARPYRWLEYMTLGLALMRTRNYHLETGALDEAQNALILGDGDGRFTARLLHRSPHLTAEAVDCSPAMLALLRRRCRADLARLSTECADARSYTPARQPEWIVTHFFLDCLTQDEVEALIARLAATPRWLVSEFRIPNGLLQFPARVLIGLLYVAFRLLTGLRVGQIPDYETPLRLAGFEIEAERRFLWGILTTQVWRRSMGTFGGCGRG